MHKLHIARTQWAVGNGFFHSGSVGSEANSLSYVYDCGALGRKPNQAALNREIDEFCRRGKRIDVCFISHFDFDHVSGIDRLASSASITQFVIPMVPPSGRLFALARQVSEETFGDALDDENFRAYSELIADPVTRLEDIAEYDPQREAPAVVEVEPAGEVPPEDEPDAEPANLNPRSVGAADRGELKIDTHLNKFTIAGSKVVWEWKYSVGNQMQSGASNFVSLLVQRGLISSDLDLDDPRVVFDLVINHRADLVQAYDDTVAVIGSSFTRNLTSLMLYSGPPLGSAYYGYRSRETKVERAEIGAWNPRPGWLALGDTDLRSMARINEMNAMWASRKPHVSTFAPSHHGSRWDWSDQLAKGFGSGGDYSPTFVFSASGAWGHPSHEVLLKINELGGTCIIVGLDERSRWTESLSVFVD